MPIIHTFKSIYEFVIFLIAEETQSYDYMSFIYYAWENLLCSENFGKNRQSFFCNDASSTNSLNPQKNLTCTIVHVPPHNCKAVVINAVPTRSPFRSIPLIQSSCRVNSQRQNTTLFVIFQWQEKCPSELRVCMWCSFTLCAWKSEILNCLLQAVETQLVQILILRATWFMLIFRPK